MLCKGNAEMLDTSAKRRERAASEKRLNANASANANAKRRSAEMAVRWQ